MASTPMPGSSRRHAASPGLRLVRIILIESLAVAIAGGLVWGIAWDIGFPTVGMIAAIVIWLTVSPVIEIATVLNYRRSIPEELDDGPQ